MSKYLLKEVKTFRTDSELEAAALVDMYKVKYDVVSYSIVRKDKKDDSYFVVKITLYINDEKNPCETFSA
ncbi:MAG TPA: hypothetical protein DCW90_06300 [Lachnospiraceae bacterium]|nr:hypothetical protein [uncultured Lachnoclostridium sp.]HAU85109.1 hypothetical protein [Lachnospiraceae bacterium]